jgi:hypothetical protein
MQEWKEAPFYQAYEEYPDSVLDIVILKNDGMKPGDQAFRSAADDFFTIVQERCYDSGCYIDMVWDTAAMKGQLISPEQFFAKPEKGQFSYAYAFLDPPQGSSYTFSDFEKLNALLFSGNDLEIWQWDNDFSNYFDEGKEWWGTGFWTVYDKKQDCFIVIGASATD